MRNLLTCGSLMIFAAGIPCNAHSLPWPEGSVKLSLISGRPVVDEVFLNGQGPYRFLLDTGAQTNQVEASIARKLGLTPTFRVDMATVAGTAVVQGGRVREVSLGSASASNQEFLFTELDGLHALSSDIQGVIGEEFLSRLDYLLDFVNHRGVFAGGVPEGLKVSVEILEGRPAIETSEGKLVIDSGTDTTILFRASSSARDSRVRTASGSASASAVRNLSLRIGGREYHAANAFMMSRGSEEEDGELPATFFHAIYLSNSGKYAILK